MPHRVTPEPPKLQSKPPPKTASGEHPAVQEMRAKFESFNEHQLAELRALSERTRRLSDHVPDHRREGTSEPPVDTIDPKDIPAPRLPPKGNQ